MEAKAHTRTHFIKDTFQDDVTVTVEGSNVNCVDGVCDRHGFAITHPAHVGSSSAPVVVTEIDALSRGVAPVVVTEIDALSRAAAEFLKRHGHGLHA